MAAARAPGFSLPELLVAIAVLTLLGAMAFRSGGEVLARQRLDAGARRLVQGLERARAEARRQGRPCALSLVDEGWQGPGGGDLPACLVSGQAVVESPLVRLTHNLPPALRVASNGLLLDGGTVVLEEPGTTVRRCLVMALPLGVMRQGRYTADPAVLLSASACEPEPSP